VLITQIRSETRVTILVLEVVLERLDALFNHVGGISAHFWRLAHRRVRRFERARADEEGF
jgi:hypothetical protein